MSIENSDFISPNTHWRIRIDKSVFDRLKVHESFWCIVALSRLVNAFRFVHSPLEHYQDNSPGSLRLRYNSFFFNCALFREASLFVQRLHRHYGQFTEFQAMVSILNSHDAKRLLETNLAPVRNSLVFHFDFEEIGTQLQNLQLEEPIFLSAMGDTNEQVYYELADLCAIRTFSGSTFENTEAGLKIVEDLLKRTTELTVDFLTKAELFISSVLERDGWKMVTSPESLNS